MSSLIEEIQVETAKLLNAEFVPGMESLTYKPASGGTRTINGVVHRDPPIEMELGNQVILPAMTIWIPNNTTNGITPTEVDSGGATIAVAYVKGGTAADYPIIGRPLSQDAGGCLWAVGSRS